MLENMPGRRGLLLPNKPVPGLFVAKTAVRDDNGDDKKQEEQTTDAQRPNTRRPSRKKEKQMRARYCRAMLVQPIESVIFASKRPLPSLSSGHH